MRSRITAAPLLAAALAASTSAHAFEVKHAEGGELVRWRPTSILRFEVEAVTTRCAASACPAGSRTVVWGGTLDGVKQVIGGTVVPSAGDRVGIPRSCSEGGLGSSTRLAE